MNKVTTTVPAVQPLAPAPAAPAFDADREVTKLRQTLEEVSRDRTYLRETINEIDSYSQTGFGDIAAIAKLALLSMEKPMTVIDIERIATVLEFIWDRAGSMEDLIRTSAELAGCPYQNQARQSRMAAISQPATSR